MRQIGTIPSERQARRFQDYLLTRDITSTVEEENSQGWAVWVRDEDHVAQARKELADFIQAPDDPQYVQAVRQAAEWRKQAQQKKGDVHQNHVDVRRNLKGPLAAHCPITYAMIAISVIVAISSSLGADPEPLFRTLGIAPYHHAEDWTVGLERMMRHGEFWRVITPIFIHFGILHILFNMVWLRELGTAIEFRRGSLRFLLITLTVAVLSNLGQYWFTGQPNFGGMSGVIFGLFGYLWMKSRYDPAAGFYIHPNMAFWMIGWFLLCLTGWVGNVANAAHGFGLAVGGIVGYAPILWRSRQHR